MSNLASNPMSGVPLPPPPAPPKKRRPPARINYRKLIGQLPPGSTLILNEVGWVEYARLLQDIGEASGLRVSYHNGEIQIMTLSTEHENYALLIEKFMAAVTLMLRIKIISFGSATIKPGRAPGAEPDCCFYVQSAHLIGHRIQLDFRQDPLPDVVVEIDIHHKSDHKLDIYSALGVPEFWLFDGGQMKFYLLREGRYAEVDRSQALPVLTSEVLTRFLRRSRQEDQAETLFAFQDWLNALPK